jgi:anthranilate phosphoribosyltransferase
MVVHGDGVDEIALHAPTRVAELRDGRVRLYEIAPEDAGLQRAPLRELLGGDTGENVRIALAVLAGERGARRDVVVLNAAAALLIAGQADTLKEGARRAAEAIDSGGAQGVVERLRALCPLRSGAA